MQLKDYIARFSFDEVYEQLCLMLEEPDNVKSMFAEAYALMQTLEPVPTKKTLHYQLIDAPDGEEEYFSGAPDSCFNTTWEVILAKEVVVDEECELSDIELLAKAFLCTVAMGRCPRAFLPSKRKLLGVDA